MKKSGKGTPYGDGYIRAGYRVTSKDGIQRADHIRVAEEALGKPLPEGAVVHHVNHVKTDNRPTNLVICPSAGYHTLIHAREKALNECGHADWRKCKHCKNYDSPENLKTVKAGSYHQSCYNSYNRSRYAARKELTQ